jgi:hypothetical protein
MKNTLYPKNVKDIKGKVAIAELRRAHYIIVVLAVAFVFMLITSMFEPLQFDLFLGSVASALILIVAAVSLSTAIALPRK